MKNNLPLYYHRHRTFATIFLNFFKVFCIKGCDSLLKLKRNERLITVFFEKRVTDRCFCLHLQKPPCFYYNPKNDRKNPLVLSLFPAIISIVLTVRSRWTNLKLKRSLQNVSPPLAHLLLVLYKQDVFPAHTLANWDRKLFPI